MRGNILIILAANSIILFYVGIGSVRAEGWGIRFGNDKIELPNSGVTIDSTGDLVVVYDVNEKNPIEEMKSRARFFESLSVQAEKKALEYKGKYESLEGWEVDRRNYLMWIKGAALALFLSIFIGCIMYLREYRAIAKARVARVRGVGREGRMLLELAEFYWRLDNSLRRLLLPFSVISVVPALLVGFIIIQHDSLVDILKLDSSLWPIVASVATPIIFYLTLAAGVHDRLSKLLELTKSRELMKT